MTTSVNELAKLLDQLGLQFEPFKGQLIAQIRSGEGSVPYLLKFGVRDEGLVFFATSIEILPKELVVCSPHRQAFMAFLLNLAWRTPFCSPEVDAQDGELRVLVEIPLADAVMTARQLELIIKGLCTVTALIKRDGAAILEGRGNAGSDTQGPASPDEPSPQGRHAASAAGMARVAVLQNIDTAQGRSALMEALEHQDTPDALKDAIRDALPLLSALDAGIQPKQFAWEQPLLQRSQVVRRWAEELGQAMASAGRGDDELGEALLAVGRGALLETDSAELSLACAQGVADTLGIPLLETQADNILETLLGLRSTAACMVVHLSGDTPWGSAELDKAPRLTAAAFEDESTKDLMRQPDARPILLRSLLQTHQWPSLIFVTHTPEIAKFSLLLSAPGLFDRRFGLGRLPDAVLGRRLLEAIGLANCGQSLLGHPAKVWLLMPLTDAAAREATVHQLKRLARKLARPLEFSDLVTSRHTEFVERDDANVSDATGGARDRELVAYHEAGHAVMAMVASGGRHIPEHATILPSGSTGGFVLSNMTAALSAGHQTFARFQSDVRVRLAGRAAEDLVFGAESVTTGAGSDLESATALVTAHFARAGFGPDFLQPEGSGLNLAVWDLEKPALAAEMQRMVQRWLAAEYLEVKRLLTEYRVLLDETARALIVDPVQDQGELEALWAKLFTIPRRHSITNS